MVRMGVVAWILNPTRIVSSSLNGPLATVSEP